MAFISEQIRSKLSLGYLQQKTSLCPLLCCIEHYEMCSISYFNSFGSFSLKLDGSFGLYISAGGHSKSRTLQKVVQGNLSIILQACFQYAFTVTGPLYPFKISTFLFRSGSSNNLQRLPHSHVWNSTLSNSVF